MLNRAGAPRSERQQRGRASPALWPCTPKHRSPGPPGSSVLRPGTSPWNNYRGKAPRCHHSPVLPRALSPRIKTLAAPPFQIPHSRRPTPAPLSAFPFRMAVALFYRSYGTVSRYCLAFVVSVCSWIRCLTVFPRDRGYTYRHAGGQQSLCSGFPGVFFIWWKCALPGASIRCGLYHEIWASVYREWKHVLCSGT